MKRTLISQVIASLVAIAILAPTSVLGSSVGNISITQMNFGNNQNLGNGADPFPAGETRITDFLGGSSDQCALATDCDSERRIALDTIPNAFDWAYWDPSGLGNNVDTGGPYHAGRQVQWASKFSTGGANELAVPHGLIDPVNLDSLGAKWNLDTGAAVAESGQGSFRATDSGAIGLRLDETGGAGSRFTLQMAIPDGQFLVSLFQDNRTRDTAATIDFPGVSQISIPPVGATGADDYALQFIVDNDSGSEQVLTYVIGDLDGNSTGDGDFDVRFSAAVIQVVPEPGAITLASFVALGMIARRRRR